MIEQGEFEQLTAQLFAYVKPEEVLTLELSGERSHFMRFNRSKVRQLGEVQDFDAELTLYAPHPDGGTRRARRSRSLSLVGPTDLLALRVELEALRKTVHQLPADPFCTLPEQRARSLESQLGQLPELQDLPQEVLKPLGKAPAGTEWVGVYQGGPILRAYASSLGSLHWFISEQFELDLSLHAPPKEGSDQDVAVKITLSGHTWDAALFRKQVAAAVNRIELLTQVPLHPLKPGKVRAYLEPAAVADILELTNYGGAFSEAAFRQGQSPFHRLRHQGIPLSSKLSIDEDFKGVQVHRYTETGELSPSQRTLVGAGQLAPALASARSAREYHLQTQPSPDSEFGRALCIRPGHLKQKDVLETLERGIYLSRLHYLNWSDKLQGRLTGMTRFAAFWVEDGELQAPLPRLRFDDTLERLFGTELLELGETAERLPRLDTYDRRHPGGTRVPGLLLKSLRICS